MDRDIEREFVKTFLQKEIQERIIFELESIKKRKTAIHRFCHTTDKIVKSQLILHKSKALTNQEILGIINGLSKERFCYTISLDEEIDGKPTTIINAISHCIGYGMPSVIIIGKQIAIIETEQECGAAYKYIMHTLAK